MSDNPKMDEIAELRSQLQIARSELKNLREKMNNFTRGYKKDIDKIYEGIKTWTCSECKNSNAANAAVPSTSKLPADLDIKYIGIIKTSFPNKKGTPRQPTIASEVKGQIILTSNLFTNNNHSLEGLEKFSHMWIIFHFHETEPTTHAKVAPPRLDGARVGVFSSRSPHRPNPIGLSLVRIGNISESSIEFYGVDMIDGTPVIDIKPYIPRYDNPCMVEENLDENLDVFVPDWINRKATLNVTYSETAIKQAEKFACDIRSISDVLKADPRSVYKRKRYSDDSLKLQVLGYNITCKFSEDEDNCHVTNIENIEETAKT